MVSQTITIDVAGSPMPAYLARPDDDGQQRQAVIVLQEIFGVNTEVKRIADLVAAAGYVGLAINYYHRTHPDLNEPYTPEGFQAGFKAAGAVSKASLRQDVAASIDWLNACGYVERNQIATWGFCFGGTVAFVTSTLPGLVAAICFYGTSIAAPLAGGEPEAIADAADVRCPLLLVYGGQDTSITTDHIERTRAALTAAHKQFEIQVYPEQNHAFFRDSGAQLDAHGGTANAGAPDDVADAWDRVQTFLRRSFA
ncbi:MAG: dienelactone hydrolase family protein [Candidatus Elarobacter sp.]